MHKFDRITTDYRKLGGLPHFRDTNITVSDVVRLVMDGKPNADILAQYPDLEPDDIQGALAYIVSSLVQNIGMTRFEMAGKLSNIAGATEILSESDDLDDEEKERLIQMCRQSIGPATRLIYQLQDWSRYACFGVPEGSLPISMSVILDKLRITFATNEIEFDIVAPEMLTDARSDDYLPLFTVFNALAAGDLIVRSENSVQITVNQVNDRHVLSIRRTFLDSPNGVSRFIEQFKTVASYPHDLAIAALIIHQHGSELKILPDDEGVTFEFELPVWQGDD